MQTHEAISCLNMNECCVNASAVIFRQISNRSPYATAVSLAVAQGNVATVKIFCRVKMF